MLSKDKRLNLKKEFTWVAAGEKSGNQFLKLFFRFGSNLEPRIGIATSKNTFRNAIDRNRARRLVSFGAEQLYRQIARGANIIVLPKKETLKLSSEEMANSLLDLLKKNKLII